MYDSGRVFGVKYILVYRVVMVVFDIGDFVVFYVNVDFVVVGVYVVCGFVDFV